MPTPLTLAQFSALGEPILNQVFFAGFDRAIGQGQSVLPLFATRTSTKRYEYIEALGGMGTYKKRTEGGPVNFDTMEALFKTTFEMEEYNKTIGIDQNLIADQNYLQINDIVTNMGLMAGKTRRKDAASVFNHAFSASYLGGDGKALCASDHPLDKGGSITGSNAGSLALTYANVVTTNKLMTLQMDARNEPCLVIPDTLVVPYAKVEEAWQIANAMGKPGEISNNGNFFKGLNVVADPYLDASDVNNWFLVDSLMAQMHLLWFDRTALTFLFMVPTAIDKNYYVGGDMRYDFGWSDWRWIYGNDASA